MLIAEESRTNSLHIMQRKLLLQNLKPFKAFKSGILDKFRRNEPCEQMEKALKAPIQERLQRVQSVLDNLTDDDMKDWY